MDTDAPGPSGPELREYTALLRRRWRLLGAGVLGGLALAAAAVIGLPSTYTSVAAVQVRPSGMAEFTGERSGRLAGEVNLDTEAQILVSDRVSSAVAETLPGDGPGTEELRERVDVSVPPNSSVLEISYSAPSPEAARAGAQAYADVYLEARLAGIDDLVGNHLEALRGEQEARYEDLAEAAAEDSPGADARVDALRAEITELGNAITPLSALAETVDPGRVITPADLPEAASSPRPVLWLVSGAALGLMAGLFAAVVRDRLDPRLHGTEDTARIGAVPVLLDLSGRVRRGARFPGLLSDGDRRGQRVHEFTHLVRARLAVGSASDGVTGLEAEEAGESASGRVLLVAATTPGRAGTATAVNLAAALARTGSETLLVCTDPRTDTVGELLGLPEGPGLAEALLEGEDPADLEVRPDAAPRLRVLRYGSPGLNAPVQDTATAELVRLLRAGAEYVVVAAAPVSERADVHALAGTADLLLPVVELGRTRGADLTGLLVLADRFGVAAPGTAVLPRQPLAGPAPVASASAGGSSEPEHGNEAPDETDGAHETPEAEETTKTRGTPGIALTGIVSDVPVAAGASGTRGAGGTARPVAPTAAERNTEEHGTAKSEGTAASRGSEEVSRVAEVAGTAGSSEAAQPEWAEAVNGTARTAEATGEHRAAKYEETSASRQSGKVRGVADATEVSRTTGAEEKTGPGLATTATGTSQAGEAADTGEAARSAASAGAAGDAEVPATGEFPAGFEVPRVLGSDGASEVPVTPEDTTTTAATSEAEKAFGLSTAAGTEETLVPFEPDENSAASGATEATATSATAEEAGAPKETGAARDTGPAEETSGRQGPVSTDTSWGARR